MPKPFCQIRARELAMRCLLIVQPFIAARPDFVMVEIADELSKRFDMSRATAWRYAHTALDVLGIDYVSFQERQSAKSARKKPPRGKRKGRHPPPKDHAWGYLKNYPWRTPQR